MALLLLALFFFESNESLIDQLGHRSWHIRESATVKLDVRLTIEPDGELASLIRKACRSDNLEVCCRANMIYFKRLMP